MSQFDNNDYKPGLLGGLGNSINDLLARFQKVKKSTVSDYCPLVGVVNDYTYFQDNTSLVTTFEVKGATFLVGDAERKHIVSDLQDVFTTLLREPNCGIQIVYQRDRRQIKERLEGLYQPMLGKAKSLKLDAERLINERINKLVPYLAGTEVYISVYTYPTQLISTQAMKEFRKQQNIDMDPDYPVEGYNGIQVYMEPDVVEHRHESTVRALETALKKMRIEAVKLSVHDAAYIARKLLFPEETAPTWRPRLPGDDNDTRVYQMSPYTLNNIDAYTYPSIGRQIAAAGVDRGEGALNGVNKVGSRYVGTQLMQLSPTTPKSFDDFMEQLGDMEMPIRVSMTFYGGAEAFYNKISLKKGLAYLTALTWPANKKIAAAAETLTDEIDEKGKSACGISLAVSTWADDAKTAESRVKKLGRAMDAWGDMQTAPEVGDPLLAFTATIPGWADNLRHVVVTTVDKLLGSIPFNVITSPWKEGVLFFKNKQGGIFPYAPLSSEQQTTNALCFAPPGGGKSVLISTLILAAVLDPVLEGLPKIAAIDIGNSSKGVVNLLREIAPPELRDKFIHVEFELTDRFGINVMDTRPGCYKPTSAERGFLINFLTLILTPVGSETPMDDATQLATILLDEAYTKFYEDSPLEYETDRDLKVRNWLDNQRDFEVKKGVTWWEIVQFAMSKKAYDIASSAQRYAVPNIKMLPALLTMSDTLRSLYGADSPILTEAKRLLLGFVSQYPSLCRPSVYDFQDTDVCIIDLNKVTQDSGPEGTRRTSIAYMVSRYLLGKDFLLNKDILLEMPPMAQEYYRSKVAQLEVVRKYLIYDEFHRTKGATAVRRTVLDDMRNGRKFNLMVMLASQNFNDFDEDVIQQATVRFVMRVDSPEDAEALVKKYGWSETVRKALIREVKGAGKDGAVMLMHASGLKTEDGQCTQVLTNLIGSTELAAYATTREDAALRDAVIDMGLPYWDAVTLIGKLYPSGVKKLVEDTMRKKRGGPDSTVGMDEDADIKGALGPMLTQIKEAYTAQKIGGY